MVYRAEIIGIKDHVTEWSGLYGSERVAKIIASRKYNCKRKGYVWARVQAGRDDCDFAGFRPVAVRLPEEDGWRNVGFYEDDEFWEGFQPV